jgi:hypothetical protein
MTFPGAYPPAQAGQGNQSAVIAAPPGEQLAEALAAELRNLGWRVAVTEQVEPYAREARVCVVPLTPTSVNSPALAAALATPPSAPLIPLVVGATPLPPGHWATPPITFSGDPAQTAREIAGAASSLGAAPSVGPSMQPPAGATMPYAPAPASQPLQPYQGGPAYPTQPGYAQYPQGGAPYAPPAAPSAPAKRRWPVIVGVVLAVILVLCVAGGAIAYAGLNKFAGKVSIGVSQTETALASDSSSATSTPVTTATPAIPSDFTPYTDSAAGFSIAYPNTWQKSKSGNDVLLVDPYEAADMVIGSVNANIPQSDINSTESQFFKSAAGGGSYSNLQGPTTVTYAGESWTEESADITSSSQTLHAVVLVANHGSRAYVIGYLSAKSSFATMDAQDFQPMLNSFTFLS